MKILIVDDEPLARDVLRFFLSSERSVSIVGMCENGDQALQAVRHEAPDLVLLDVQMPGLSGIEVLRQMGENMPPAVVFVTAFDQHAVDAFELHAIDYLLKPVEEDRFRRCMERVRHQLALRDLRLQADRFHRLLSSFEEPTSRAVPTAASDRLLVRRRDKITVVRLENLDWAEAAGDYVYLHCGPEKHLVRQSLGKLEARLDPRKFRRIHRRTLVNLEHIDEFRFADHGELQVRLQNGTLLKVSRTYRQSLADFLEADKV